MKLDHYSPITHRAQEYMDLGNDPTGWQRHRVALAIAAVLGSLGMVLAVATAATVDAPSSSNSRP